MEDSRFRNTLIAIAAGIWPVFITKQKWYEHSFWKMNHNQAAENLVEHDALDSKVFA